MPTFRCNSLLTGVAGILVALLAFAPSASTDGGRADIPRWGLFEAAFTSARTTENPLQDSELRVTFTAPSRRIASRTGR